jgi:hypothetical protein
MITYDMFMTVVLDIDLDDGYLCTDIEADRLIHIVTDYCDEVTSSWTSARSSGGSVQTARKASVRCSFASCRACSTNTTLASRCPIRQPNANTLHHTPRPARDKLPTQHHSAGLAYIGRSNGRGGACNLPSRARFIGLSQRDRPRRVVPLLTTTRRFFAAHAQCKALVLLPSAKQRLSRCL